MAQVAATRIDQMQDPELSIEQAVADYLFTYPVLPNKFAA